MWDGGFVYLLAEGDAEKIAQFRTGACTPTHYKVGKALWGKKGFDARSPFQPIEQRLKRAQSCNPFLLGVLAAAQFDTDKIAEDVECSFHEHHRDKHGVRLWPKHEWYFGHDEKSFAWQRAMEWVTVKGGLDQSRMIPPFVPSGGYEEGPGQTKGAAEEHLNVYVLRLEAGQETYFRVLATTYPKADNKSQNPHRWYNTGNWRLVTLDRSYRGASTDLSVSSFNVAAREVLVSLRKRYGLAQIAWCVKPRASWNTLAWFKERPERFYAVLDDVTVAIAGNR